MSGSEYEALLAHLKIQCGDWDVAYELVERKKKNPSLCSTSMRGKFISFTLPNRRCSEKFDEMVESGNVPSCMTDSTFLEGHCNGNQFEKDPKAGDYYAAQCRKYGGDPKGKVYKKQLAPPGKPGHPSAWVSGRGDVQKVLEQRGWGSDGAVKVRARQPAEAPAPPKDVANKIVDRETAIELEGQTVTKKEYRDVREKVKKRLTPSWKKK